VTEEPSDHDEQLEGSLAYLLDGRIDVHDVLPLTAPLEELILSIRHSRVATWRHDQRESLAVDMDASGAIIGDEVRIELGQALVDVQTLAEILLRLRRAQTFARHPDLPRLLSRAEALRARLLGADVRRAAWRDIVNGVRSSEPEKLLADRVRLLFALLAAAHLDVDEDRRYLHWLVKDGAPRTEGGAQSAPSIAKRLADSEDYVGRVAASGNCIAWVALEGTRLPEFVMEAGPVTFFVAEWAVPNAQHDDGQLFLHRDELREIAAISFTDIPQDPNVVLARVELGHRPSAGALDEAWRRAMFVAGYATLSARSEPWPKRGWYCLDIDDRQSHGWFAPDELFRERTSSQIERIGFELAAIARGIAAQTTWSSPELIEAVNCANEARRADVRNRNLLRWRVLEMVAAYTGVEAVDELLDLLKGQWARDALGSRPVRAVIWTVMGVPQGSPQWGDARALNGELLKHHLGGRIELLVPRAVARSSHLMTLARTELDRRSLGRHLEVLKSSTATLDRLAELDREEELLYRRTRRVRNALMHGDPITIEAISSVDNYLMYMTEFALQEAITSPPDKPLADLLRDIRAVRDDVRKRLQAGGDPVRVLGLDRP